jgi:aspartate aminotransferase-like enzyme
MFRGSLTAAPTFRIGCMGAFDQRVIARVVEAVRVAMAELGMRDGAPAQAETEPVAQISPRG